MTKVITYYLDMKSHSWLTGKKVREDCEYLNVKSKHSSAVATFEQQVLIGFSATKSERSKMDSFASFVFGFPITYISCFETIRIFI